MKNKKMRLIVATLLMVAISVTAFASCDMFFVDLPEISGDDFESDHTPGGNQNPGGIQNPSGIPEGTSIFDPEQSTEKPTETATEIIPDETVETQAPEEEFPTEITKNNYNSSFYLSIVPDPNPINYYWVEDAGTNAVSEALFARQERIKNYLGVEIVCYSAGTPSSYVTPFKTSVKNCDGSVDILMSHVSVGVASIISERYIQDFSSFPGIDLDRSYWNSNVMDALAIDDHYFLGYSDFNVPYAHVIAFNKEMMEVYAPDLEKSPYEMVEDYEWTLDAMLNIAKLVSIDRTGDGKTNDDTFGITGQQWLPWIGFFQASNISLVEQNDNGKYTISISNSKYNYTTAGLVQKLRDLSNSNYAMFAFPDDGVIPAHISLGTGRTLMQLASTYSTADFVGYDIDFGVLPYPMYDTAQKDVGYRSLQWGGYLCIPAYVRNPQMVGETLELLSFDSKEVRNAFYEQILGKALSDAPEDVKMLEIVRKGICSDMGQAYAESCPGILYLLPYVTRTGTGWELSTYLVSFERSSNTTLSKFINKVRQNIANQAN